jgi:hypothetical protein
MRPLCTLLESISKHYGEVRTSIERAQDARSIEGTEGDMSHDPDPEPDERGPVIYVGQDEAGHWLVQDGGRNMEGRFVSRSAALSFAEAERQTYHASLEIASAPLVPLIPFGPVSATEHALPRAA